MATSTTRPQGNGHAQLQRLQTIGGGLHNDVPLLFVKATQLQRLTLGPLQTLGQMAAAAPAGSSFAARPEARAAAVAWPPGAAAAGDAKKAQQQPGAGALAAVPQHKRRREAELLVAGQSHQEFSSAAENVKKRPRKQATQQQQQQQQDQQQQLAGHTRKRQQTQPPASQQQSDSHGSAESQLTTTPAAVEQQQSGEQQQQQQQQAHGDAGACDRPPEATKRQCVTSDSSNSHDGEQVATQEQRAASADAAAAASQQGTPPPAADRAPAAADVLPPPAAAAAAPAAAAVAGAAVEAAAPAAAGSPASGGDGEVPQHVARRCSPPVQQSAAGSSAPQQQEVGPPPGEPTAAAPAAAAACSKSRSPEGESSGEGVDAAAPAAAGADKQGAGAGPAAAAGRAASNGGAAGGRGRSRGPRPGSGAGDGELPTEQRVAAAVAAAGLPTLAAGDGLLVKNTSREVWQRPVRLESFHPGDVTGNSAKLFRTADDVQLTKSCHDCQAQHVPWTCQLAGCRGASVCNRCLVSRFEGRYSLKELHQACPGCRGVCSCRKCLRTADHAKLVPRPAFSPQEQRRHSSYMLRLLGPALAALLEQQDREARAWGLPGGLSDVPQEALLPRERVLCDRCGTQVVGLLAHCSSCCHDICSSCCQELRVAAAGTAGQPDADAAAAAVVTCSNPSCPSVTGLPADSEQAQELQQQEVCRGGLFSIPGAQQLQLRMLLASDLLPRLPQLQQLSQEHRESPALQLSDCPLLSPEALESLPPHPDSGLPLTLADLQSDTWYQALPVGVRDAWRRRATSSTFLFTPAAADLQLPCEAAATAAAARGTGGGGRRRSGSGQGDADNGSGSGSGGGDDGGAGSPHWALARALFWARWLLGEPIIVTGLQGRITWDPFTLHRAVRDLKQERAKAKPGKAGTAAAGAGAAGDDEDDEGRVAVLDCFDFKRVELSQYEFFKGYKAGHFIERPVPGGVGVRAAAMLKVKDWPPNSQFREELQRHYVDFLEQLPLRRCYTDPRLSFSPLNMAGALLPPDNPTDLGPKFYVAFGRVAEASGERDSVTKLHLDMADAVNLLLDCHVGGDPETRQAAAERAAAGAGARVARCGDAPADKPSYNGAGAVWDIVRRGDTTRLASWLAANAGDFTHQGEPVSTDCPLVAVSPVQSQVFMMVERHRQQLLQEAGVEPWHFEQHLGEAVFIPGGCPHQVRNLMSCSKVAVDFVSPESLAATIRHREHLRRSDLALLQPLGTPPEERVFQEKLQSQLMLLRAALAAAEPAG